MKIVLLTIDFEDAWWKAIDKVDMNVPRRCPLTLGLKADRL